MIAITLNLLCRSFHGAIVVCSATVYMVRGVVCLLVLQWFWLCVLSQSLWCYLCVRCCSLHGVIAVCAAAVPAVLLLCALSQSP